jgi:replicative DNA helicase
MKKELNLKTSEEILQAYFDAVTDYSKGNEELIETQLMSLDLIIRGMKKGELMLVFGAPFVGKTAFILQLLNNFATKNKKSVLLFSPENSAYDIAERMIIADSGIRRRELYTGNLEENEWLDLNIAGSRFSEADIKISDASYLPLDRLTATVEKAVKDNKTDIVLIDSIDNIGYDESTAEKVMALKNIACAYNVLVICSCGIPHTQDEANKNAYIRKTGEHADVAIGIKRDLFGSVDDSRETYLMILKNNKGGKSSVIMTFDPDRYTFKEQNELYEES